MWSSYGAGSVSYTHLDVYKRQGESGIGKSEAALELIKRGHRLVSDDVVEIRKVSDVTLVGSAPDITRHFIELRGIGIIDVKTLFGVESVKDTQSIDLVIKLEAVSYTHLSPYIQPSSGLPGPDPGQSAACSGSH